MTTPAKSTFETEAAGHVPAPIATPPAPDGDAANASQQHGDTPTPSPLTRPLPESEAPETSGHAAFPPATDRVTLRATGECSDGPPQLLTVRAALAYVRPDSDPAVVTNRVLGPLAWATREHPDSASWIAPQAHQWWRGTYHDIPGLEPRESLPNRGCAEFDELWDRLLRADPGAQQLTLGTLYTDAADAGWPALTTDQLYTKQEQVDTWQEQRDLNMELVEDLMERLSDGSADAPFEHEFIEALAYFCDDDPYEFSRIKARLKRANPQVSLIAIDEAVSAINHVATTAAIKKAIVDAATSALSKEGT